MYGAGGEQLLFDDFHWFFASHACTLVLDIHRFLGVTCGHGYWWDGRWDRRGGHFDEHRRVMIAL